MRPVLTFLCIALGLACLASAALRDRYTENFCEDKLQCANDSSDCADSFCKGNRPLTTDDCFVLDDYNIFETCCDGDNGDRNCFDRQKRSSDYRPRSSSNSDDNDNSNNNDNNDNNNNNDDRNVFEKVGDNVRDTFTGDDNNAASSLLGSSGVWEMLLKAGAGTSLVLLLW